MMKRTVVCLLVLVLLLSVLSTCRATADDPLPRSMKGYELYSWQEEGQWHFTLITGTNRNKTLAEIVSGENIEAEDGWVSLHVAGVGKIKDILSRVPTGEFVGWSGGQFVLPTEQSVSKLVLPPKDIVDEIKACAEQLGIDFTVFGH